MAEKSLKALIVGTNTATSVHLSGASIRLKNVANLVDSLGFDVKIISKANASDFLKRLDWDLVVLVSFSNLKFLRLANKKSKLVWLDNTDSIYQTRKSLLLGGDFRQPILFFIDYIRVFFSKPPAVISYVTHLDAQSDTRVFKLKVKSFIFPLKPEQLVIDINYSSPRLVFVGDGNYLPNQKAIDFLVDVLKHLGDTYQIDVYGIGYQKRSHPGFQFHGYQVDRELYRFNDLHLAPIIYGAGMKAKVAIPLKNGIRVLSTSKGANGFEPSPILSIADTPIHFADAIKEIISKTNFVSINRQSTYTDDETEQLLALIEKHIMNL
jgi:hypothetical protein